MLVACYTKSGGSWLTWMLIDILHKPKFYCDQVNKTVLDKLIHKTESVLDTKPDVHCMRHPLDVACSWHNYNLLTNRNHSSFDQHIENYFADAHKYKNFIQYGKRATHQIRYEDLLDNTEQTLKQIVGDRDVSEAIKKYSVEHCRLREHSVMLDRPNNKKYSFFNRATKYYYKDMLNEQQQQKGFAVFRDIIKEYWPETIEEKI